MIRKENGAIVLDGVVKRAMSYQAPNLNDDDFIATLVEELENYIDCTREGTKGRYFPISSLEQAAEAVIGIVNQSGVADRKDVIRQAFNACSTTSPNTMDGRKVNYLHSAFLNGVDLHKECKLSEGIVCIFDPGW